MKLAVSNIAWRQDAEDEALAILRSHAITGIEVAPTRWWPGWRGASKAEAAGRRRCYEDRGFTLPAFQAILFGRPCDQLFGNAAEQQSLLNHLRFCADLAAAAGVCSLVLGAPKNRRLNELSPTRAFDAAAVFFSQIAPYYAERGLSLCLEANPAQYECEFVTCSSEAAALVRAVASPGFALHLDTGCMHLSGEDFRSAIEQHFDIVRHFHVSEPFLGSFESPVAHHRGAAEALRGMGYQGWVSLEMRETTSALTGLAEAAAFLARTYRDEP